MLSTWQVHVRGEGPELRWGHTLNAYRQWLVVFGGHRRRGYLNDTHFFDTEALVWDAPIIIGELPPPRGNHATAIAAHRLWLFGGDFAGASDAPQVTRPPASPHARTGMAPLCRPASVFRSSKLRAAITRSLYIKFF